MCRLCFVRWFWRLSVVRLGSIACTNKLCSRIGAGSGNILNWNDFCLPSRGPLTVRSVIHMIRSWCRTWNIVRETDWTTSRWFCLRILNLVPEMGGKNNGKMSYKEKIKMQRTANCTHVIEVRLHRLLWKSHLVVVPIAPLCFRFPSWLRFEWRCSRLVDAVSECRYIAATRMPPNQCSFGQIVRVICPQHFYRQLQEINDSFSGFDLDLPVTVNLLELIILVFLVSWKTITAGPSEVGGPGRPNDCKAPAKCL